MRRLLATFLVVTTLAGGLFAYRGQCQDSAIREIEDAGGVVAFESEVTVTDDGFVLGSVGPPKPRSALDRRFADVVRVDFLGRFGFKRPATDTQLQFVARLPQLIDVDLSNTKVTDAGLRYLYPLAQLRTICLTGTMVTARGIADFRKQRPEVRLLWGLDSHVALTGGQVVRDDSGRVVEVDLSGKHFDFAILAALLQCPHLTSLSLEFTYVTDDALPALASMETLKHLNLSNAVYVSDAGVRSLASMANLQSLDLSGTYDERLLGFGISGASVGELAGIPSLATLNLSGAGLDDGDVSALLALKQLKHLDVSNNRLDPATILTLTRGLPNTRVTH